MKWAFLINSPDISGGIYVIFEHAIRFKQSGIEIYMITENKVEKDYLDWHPEAKELTWVTFSQVQEMKFDLAIATLWRTVYELYRINAKTYAYFVQSIESRFYSPKELSLRKLVESTYMLPLNFVTEVHWIQDYLKEHFDQNSSVVLNGIRKDIYLENGKAFSERVPGKLRVLIEGPLKVPFKNVERTIDLCRRSLADEIWLMTSSVPSGNLKVDKIFSRVPIHKTPLVYRSCDVLVKLSYVEGMFGPPLEMFHCGGTAVVYNVTGHDEYIQHNYNALVVNMNDEKKVIEYINQLKKDPVLLNKLKIGALKTAAQWPSWDESSNKFMQILIDISNNTSISQRDIERQSRFYFNWYEIAESYQVTIKNRKLKNIIFPPNSKRRIYAVKVLNFIHQKINNHIYALLKKR